MSATLNIDRVFHKSGICYRWLFWGVFLFILFIYYSCTKKFQAAEDLLEPFSVKICYNHLHSLQRGILAWNFSNKTKYETIAPIS